MCVRVCARVHACVCVSFILFPVVMLATGYEPVSTAVKYSVYVLGVRAFWEGSKEPGGGQEDCISHRERPMLRSKGWGSVTSVSIPEQMIIRWS